VKITHVEVWPVTVPAANPPFSWRHGVPGSPPTSEQGILRIGTDEGVSGVALAGRPGSYVLLQEIVDRVLRDELVGNDPRQREYLWHRIWEIDRIEEFPLPLLGIVDIALWDLAGRLYGAPVWQLLGGFRTQLPAYASTSSFATTEEFLDVADQSLELGYHAIKLHAWGDARKDAALSLALREHVGPEIQLMYDGSAGFDLPDAIYLGHALSDAGFLWYEEPMREFSITAYSQLARAVDVPLLVAETSDGAHMNSADFIRAGAATFGVRASTGLRGGITGAMRTAHLADSYRLRAEVHGMDIPNHHLCMAISNTTYYESLVTSNPVRRESILGPDGMLKAPVGPGAGLPPELSYPPELAEFVAHYPASTT
jgi:L-alanine-DL-glutamate epimerase-like enolase superfamily enzyme